MINSIGLGTLESNGKSWQEEGASDRTEKS